MGLGNGIDYLGLPLSPVTDSSSWTDDLPICTATGVGFSPNQLYRRDGYRNNEHDLEDQSFHFKLDENICLYGVFDGHCGSQAAKFAVQRMPAEILLGQLSENSSEEEVRTVLEEAFLSVEREYFSDIIGSKLAERTALMAEIPEGKNPYDTLKDYPELLSQLESLNREVASGCTAVVVLIFHGKLYVSNVGHSKALLLRTDYEGILRVQQLSIDHDLKNDKELERLQKLNLDTIKIKSLGRLGNQENTRCIGNYLVKGGYKEVETLSSATNELVIPLPEIHPGVLLDESCRLLILVTDGLHRALQEASDSDAVNSQLAQMIVDEFKTQSTLTGVSQAVVDRISRMHYDFYMSSTTPWVNRREDMTLLVRNFNFPLQNSNSPTSYRSSGRLSSASSSSIHNYSNSTIATPTNNLDFNSPQLRISYSRVDDPAGTSTNTNTNANTEATTSTETTSSTDLLTQSNHRLPLDENGKIKAYVDFSDFFKNQIRISPSQQQQQQQSISNNDENEPTIP